MGVALPSCSGPQGQMGWEGPEPLDRKPPGKTSKCFTGKSGPYITAVFDPGPWFGVGGGGCLATKKASASTHRVNTDPETTFLSPQREQWPGRLVIL